MMNWTPLKLKIVPSNNMKGPATDCEEIFVNHILHKELYPEYTKNLTLQ